MITLPGGGDMDSPRTVATSAGIHDAWLCGRYAVSADRVAAARVGAAGNSRGHAVSNRRFAQRAVGLLVDRGIDQYLDLGCGYPVFSHGGMVHEWAPRARVLYV